MRAAAERRSQVGLRCGVGLRRGVYGALAGRLTAQRRDGIAEKPIEPPPPARRASPSGRFRSVRSCRPLRSRIWKSAQGPPVRVERSPRKCCAGMKAKRKHALPDDGKRAKGETIYAT